MTEGRKWFRQNFKDDTNKIYTSKYYRSEESWPKTEVWWLLLPLTAIDTNKYDYLNFICQVAPGKNDFHYLKVPTEFLQDHLDKFHRIGKMVDIYLSNLPENLFVELRGIERLNFSRFVKKNEFASSRGKISKQ